MKTMDLPNTNKKTTNDINVNMEIEENGLLDITLLDLQGNLLYNHSDFVQNGQFDFTLPVERPGDRKTILRVAINGKSTIKKIIP